MIDLGLTEVVAYLRYVAARDRSWFEAVEANERSIPFTIEQDQPILVRIVLASSID